jgi:catechol 2,3-dioxygenase-like lactoylglutathione lyase family enzyme
MIDHIGLSVADYRRSKTFYERALAPLGYLVRVEIPDSNGGMAACGFSAGASGNADFWIVSESTTLPALHLAFEARDRKTVDAFHAAALAAGGSDNGAPGIRAKYHPNYYAAFVLDPDGHNIEAVCHSPGAAADQKSF